MKKSILRMLAIAFMAALSVGFVSCGDDDLPEGWSKASGILIKYDIYHKKYLDDHYSFNGYVHNDNLYAEASENATLIGSVGRNVKSTVGTYDVSGYSYSTSRGTNGGTQEWLYFYNYK